MCVVFEWAESARGHESLTVKAFSSLFTVRNCSRLSERLYQQSVSPFSLFDFNCVSERACLSLIGPLTNMLWDNLGMG